MSISGDTQFKIVAALLILYIILGAVGIVSSFSYGASEKLLTPIVREIISIALLVFFLRGHKYSRITIGVLSAITFLVLGFIFVTSIAFNTASQMSRILIAIGIPTLIAGLVAWMMFFSKSLRQSMLQRQKSHDEKTKSERKKYFEEMGEKYEE